MNEMTFNFPVICFHPEFALMFKDWTGLTTTTRYALKHNKLANLLIVDSSGKAVRVNGARKLHGVGPFGGYTIFFNQWIRVELFFEGEPFQMSVDQLRERLFKSFQEWHGWESASDFEELEQQVTNATSIKEIFDAVFG